MFSAWASKAERPKYETRRNDEHTQRVYTKTWLTGPRGATSFVRTIIILAHSASGLFRTRWMLTLAGFVLAALPLPRHVN